MIIFFAIVILFSCIVSGIFVLVLLNLWKLFNRIWDGHYDQTDC